MIPELCRCTGLTDAMKGDNRQMRLMADETRVSPRDRVQRLMKFNERLQNSEKSLEVLKEFNPLTTRIEFERFQIYCDQL